MGLDHRFDLLQTSAKKTRANSQPAIVAGEALQPKTLFHVFDVRVGKDRIAAGFSVRSAIEKSLLGLDRGMSGFAQSPGRAWGCCLDQILREQQTAMEVEKLGAFVTVVKYGISCRSIDEKNCVISS